MKEQHKHHFLFRPVGLYIHFFLTTVILILLLFFSDRTPYSYKRLFPLKNGTLLLIGALAAAVFSLCVGRRKAVLTLLETYSDKAVAALSKIFFFLQLYFCFSAYFATGWDVAVIQNGAYELALGQPLSDVAYFSRYPNNLFMTSVFSWLIKLDRCLGILDVQEGIMCILCVQCLLSSVTGFLLFKLVRSFAGYGSAWGTWLCYFVLVGTSGWLLIPYSDSVALFFPTAILYLYMKLKNSKHVPWKWGAIGALSFLGYRIKPQVIIVFIAIVIVECTRRRTKSEGGKRQCVSCILCVLAGLLLSTLLYHAATFRISEQLDHEKAFGFTHFAMMGLNDTNNGGYLTDDVKFSSSFATRSERTEANMEVIRQRLQEMGISGLWTHLTKKLLTNYGDGTFAWENEGNFYFKIYEPKNGFLSPLLRNLIWGGGKMNLLSETIRQTVWLCVLAASLGLIFRRKTEDSLLSVVSWSIVGLTLFELLFEARARYLYLYVPFYLIAAAAGAAEIADLLRTKGKKRASSLFPMQ